MYKLGSSLWRGPTGALIDGLDLRQAIFQIHRITLGAAGVNLLCAGEFEGDVPINMGLVHYKAVQGCAISQ